MTLPDFLNFFAAPLVTGLVIVFIVHYFKLPSLMKENTAAIRNLSDQIALITAKLILSEKEIELSKRRHDITQKILSDLIEHPIDTIKIVDDFGHYPNVNVFKKIRRDS